MITEYGEQMIYSAKFSIDWDPKAFLRGQEYNGQEDEIIDQVITLSGTFRHGQALTCAQYMQQTWPSRGHCVLILLKKLLGPQTARRPVLAIEFGERNAEITLSGSINGPSLTVNARGLRESIISIGQQLCWLGAALRSSLSDGTIANCWPILRKVMGVGNEILVDIEYKTIEGPMQRPVFNGECWHKLFKSPAIADRFPVRRRYPPDLGLEIPLNVMARLIPSRWVTAFDGKVYIRVIPQCLSRPRWWKILWCGT
jgi:hypothetical protein